MSARDVFKPIYTDKQGSTWKIFVNQRDEHLFEMNVFSPSSIVIYPVDSKDNSLTESLHVTGINNVRQALNLLASTFDIDTTRTGSQ